MKTVVLVPARSRSETVPDKNIKLLAGKPLLAYPIEVAKASPIVDAVYLSTDSPQYAEIGKKYGAEPLIRPYYLAEDVPSEWVVWHACDALKLSNEDLIVTMQCTTPLVSHLDLHEAIQLVKSQGGIYDCAISVTQVREVPQWMFREEGNYLRPAFATTTKGAWGVRQTHQKLYRPNGGIYVTKVKLLRESWALINERCGFVEMPPERGFDIDDEFDFRLVNAFLEASKHV